MKRIFDLLLTIVALILLSPLFIIVMVLIKLDSEGPILFKQQRSGIHKEHFTIYKFRTMSIHTPNVATDLLEDPSKYITKLGLFLRRSSLDEIPQLINILKGDMSIVGPRPALYNQYRLIEMRDENDVTSVRPGLTGYAQVKGRDFITDEEKVSLDKYYVQHQSLLLDCKIIWWTVKSVLTADGVKLS